MKVLFVFACSLKCHDLRIRMEVVQAKPVTIVNNGTGTKTVMEALGEVAEDVQLLE